MRNNVSTFIATSLLASFLAADVGTAYAQIGGQGGSTSTKATGGSTSTGGATSTATGGSTAGGVANGGAGGTKATGGAPPNGGMGGVAGSTGGAPTVLRRRYVGVPVQGTSWLRSSTPTGLLLVFGWIIIYSIFRDRKYELKTRRIRCL